MRVLVLNHYAIPATESGGTRHIELFERLPPKWEFEIVTGDRSAHSTERLSTDHPNFRFLKIPGYQDRSGWQRVLGWIVYAVKAVVYGMRVERPDVVFASSPHLLAALAGLVIARVRRARFVLEVRDIWPESLVEFGYLTSGSPLHRLLGRLEKLLYKSADQIVIVTADWSDYFESFGIHPDRITTISNGSDPDSFEPQPSAQALVDRLKVSSPIAIYAGAHGKPNGLDYILDAAHKHPEVTFALFGDGGMKPELVKRAKQENLVNVRFCDPVPKSELASFLWTADIGIHTLADIKLFKMGLSPNKLYDYMAAGLPVISNAGGSAKDILLSSGGGIAVGPNGVAEGVSRILSLSEDERRAMGARGRVWLENNASRKAMSSLLDKALTMAMDR